MKAWRQLGLTVMQVAEKFASLCLQGNPTVSELPDEPDEGPVEAWLQQVRAAHWAAEAAS